MRNAMEKIAKPPPIVKMVKDFYESKEKLEVNWLIANILVKADAWRKHCASADIVG